MWVRVCAAKEGLQIFWCQDAEVLLQFHVPGGWESSRLCPSRYDLFHSYLLLHGYMWLRHPIHSGCTTQVSVFVSVCLPVCMSVGCVKPLQSQRLAQVLGTSLPSWYTQDWRFKVLICLSASLFACMSDYLSVWLVACLPAKRVWGPNLNIK